MFKTSTGKYKSPTGLQKKGCPLRLMELNSASKPSPTRLTGAQVARENYIRRRVAKLVKGKSCDEYKEEQCNEVYGYGPLFGLAQEPKYGGDCKNIYYANHGTGSDVVQWKRLYGGPRVLFNTRSCQYGCVIKEKNVHDRLITKTGFKNGPNFKVL